MNFIERVGRGIINFFGNNKFNQAFIRTYGFGFVPYDDQKTTYLESGYNVNPLVFSMVKAMSSKTASIPHIIKKVKDNEQYTKLRSLKLATKGVYSKPQLIKKLQIENKAFNNDEIPFPLDRPNVNQSWSEFKALYKTFIKVTGEAYIYILSPEEGKNAGEPTAIYLLPSHQVQIVVHNDVDFLLDEDPVSYYLMTHGDTSIKFMPDEIIHIKYSNPNYGESGEHLYGQSPLRAALRNMQSSNSAMDLNIKTLKNGGAFGFIHGKGSPLNENQAKELKQRLIEMDESPENLARLAGVSAEVGFTRISLTTDELKPFDYLNFDKKMIASCLEWELIDGDKSDFGGTISQLRRQRITDNIMPDLDMLCEALNDKFLPRFKKYSNMVIEFDYMELPEMQEDMAELSKWVFGLKDRGGASFDEMRSFFGLEPTNKPEMQEFTVQNDLMTVKEAVDSEFNTEIDEQEQV